MPSLRPMAVQTPKAFHSMKLLNRFMIYEIRFLKQIIQLPVINIGVFRTFAASINVQMCQYADLQMKKGVLTSFYCSPVSTLAHLQIV
jgi:hypothetical protein